MRTKIISTIVLLAVVAAAVAFASGANALDESRTCWFTSKSVPYITNDNGARFAKLVTGRYLANILEEKGVFYKVRIEDNGAGVTGWVPKRYCK